jgi:hypothetical protein
MTELYTAIIFYKPDTGITPRKYRNISNIENFAKFAIKSGGWYMNLYFKKNKKFAIRKSLTEAL